MNHVSTRLLLVDWWIGNRRPYPRISSTSIPQGIHPKVFPTLPVIQTPAAITPNFSCNSFENLRFNENDAFLKHAINSTNNPYESVREDEIK